MGKPHYFMDKEDSISIDLLKYTRGFSNSPVFEITNQTNGVAKLKSTLVTFAPSANGLAEFEFKVSDAEGSSLSQKVGIYYGEMVGDSMFTYNYYLDREKSKIVTVDSVNTISNATVVEDTTSSIEQYSSTLLDIVVFPNPASSLLNADFLSSVNSESKFYVYDIVGQILFKENFFI